MVLTPFQLPAPHTCISSVTDHLVLSMRMNGWKPTTCKSLVSCLAGITTMMNILWLKKRRILHRRCEHTGHALPRMGTVHYLLAIWKSIHMSNTPCNATWWAMFCYLLALVRNAHRSSKNCQVAWSVKQTESVFGGPLAIIHRWSLTSTGQRK